MKPNFWLFLFVAIILLCQGTWIFIDARKRGEIAWLWGLLGLLNFPTSLLVYLLENNSFIRKFMESGDYEFLARKLPPEKITDHRESDTRAMLPWIKQWQQEGKLAPERPEVIAGLFQSLFYLTLHRIDIGVEIFPEVFELFLKLISDGLATDGKKDGEEFPK